MANITWTAISGTNSWDISTNWSPNIVPTAVDNAFVTDSGTYTITVSSDEVGSLTLDNANATISIGSGALTVDNTASFEVGTISIAGGQFETGAGGSGDLTMSSGTLLDGYGLLIGQITGSGEVEATTSGQSLFLASDVTDASTSYDIGAGGNLQLAGSVVDHVNFNFLSGASGTELGIENDTNFDENISGLKVGATNLSATTNFIDFLSESSITITLGGKGTGSSGTVQFTDSNGTHTLSLSGITGASNWFVNTVSDGSSGTEVFLSNVCYAAGTRILTADGEVAVEDLSAGDMVVTLSGGTQEPQPVKWIGQRRLDLTAHPRPEHARPVRIRRGAFGDAMPKRDLVLSPEHCLLVDGRLIPVKLLVNDMTIVHELDARSVDYFHVELDRHAVLLAEGLPAESYLDTGNRAFFANAGLALILHPEFHVNAGLKCWETDACAPLVAGATTVQPVWRELADRAEALGYTPPSVPTTDEADLRLIADGRAIRPVSVEANRHLFVLPSSATSIRLASRANAPCNCTRYLADQRNLGVAVSHIVIRSRGGTVEIPADHPGLTEGWHRAERREASLWRWTNGNARLPIAPEAGPVTIEIHVSMTNRYVLCETELRGGIAA